MILAPTTVTELVEALAGAHARGEKVTAVQLRSLNRVLEHTPEDMTVTVEAGITLAVLQGLLARQGQWLPIDPPAAERATIEEILATDASGPRRFGYGTIRENLIGIRVALADGRVIKAGGKVVKNVAGFDLCKLFVGSRGGLGVIVEATFKLRPLPEAEQFVQARCESVEKAGQMVEALLGSDLVPVVLDLHNVSTFNGRSATNYFVVLGCAGSREEVDWQLAKARMLGLMEPSNLEHEAAFWSEATSDKPRRLSVLPSKITSALGKLGEVPFVARAGNGVIYYRGGPEPPQPDLPAALTQRI
jgi:FAD/FMN-containing dehydrogenase